MRNHLSCSHCPSRFLYSKQSSLDISDVTAKTVHRLLSAECRESTITADSTQSHTFLLCNWLVHLMDLSWEGGTWLPLLWQVVRGWVQ
jgi:hypothetical protein